MLRVLEQIDHDQRNGREKTGGKRSPKTFNLLLASKEKNQRHDEHRRGAWKHAQFHIAIAKQVCGG